MLSRIHACFCYERSVLLTWTMYLTTDGWTESLFWSGVTLIQRGTLERVMLRKELQTGLTEYLITGMLLTRTILMYIIRGLL